MAIKTRQKATVSKEGYDTQARCYNELKGL